MNWYTQNYIDVLNGLSPADRNTKDHFRSLLYLELAKYRPYLTECEQKSIEVSPEIAQTVSSIFNCLNRPVDLFS